MPEFTVFKHNFPHTLIKNYGQILYKIIQDHLNMYITRSIKI